MTAGATFFEELKAYVGFTAADSERLRALEPVIEPHLPRFVTHFYDAILAHPGAHAAITGGSAQVERLKGTLVEWMRSGLVGPHDEAFFERRARIGRMHVKIRLPQHYMFTAMNLIRLDFRAVILDAFAGDPGGLAAISASLDRLFDLELAIMLETFREDSDARLRTAERLATIGQLAASIGHDLRNPLGVIESSLFILRRRIGEDDPTRRHLDKISDQVGSCNHIVTDLLELARDRPPKWADVSLRDAWAAARESMNAPANVTVRENLAAPVVRADPGLLQQVLTNLLSNAVIALEGRSGTVWLSSARTPGGRVRIEVRDDGPGFSAEALARAFEPLFTTRARGTGLGLAMVQSVIGRHGGAVSAANHPDGGAVVTVELDAPGAA